MSQIYVFFFSWKTDGQQFPLCIVEFILQPTLMIFSLCSSDNFLFVVYQQKFYDLLFSRYNKFIWNDKHHTTVTIAIILITMMYSTLIYFSPTQEYVLR
jgi:hypothetical protein